MRSLSCFALALPLAIANLAPAQITIPINPRATYLRTNNDPNAVPAPAVLLSAIGAVPGQWLRIAVQGAFSDSGSADSQRTVVVVFSSNPTLLPTSTTTVSRVPGAIAAGPYAVTPNTISGNLPTDLATDFVVSRTSWASSTLVKVPLGATYLFWSPSDGLFGNNSDPNADFAIVFTPVAPAALQGTAEHVELATAVNGTPTTTPDVKQAAPFSTISVEVRQRYGLSTGDLYVLGANLYPTANPAPVGPLPDTYMGTGYALVQAGITATTPGLWSAFVPPGLAGQTLILQGFTLNANARNGFVYASDAHRIELQ